MALDIVSGRERVDQVQTVGGVGDGIAAGVAHLIFLGLFLHVFRLIGHAHLDVMMFSLVGADQLETDDVGCQVVTGVLHVGSHAQTLLRLGVVEPVLAHNVVGLLLLGVESRCQEFYTG